MSQLEMLSRETWRDFLASPAAVLMIGKTDCEACKAWTKELEAFLGDDHEWPQFRFGKLELDKPGFGEFKRENGWLADIHDLPYNVIYIDGERIKEYAGGGIDRLTNRLRRVTQGEH